MAKVRSKKTDNRSKMTVDPQLKFQVTEAYKTIRTNLMFSIAHSGCKVIAISSTIESEGKSTGAVNIAISLAQTNMKVLLIDTDLRKSKVHMFFNINSAPGLTHAISGINTLQDVIRKTNYSNLDIITSGTTPPNPSELLASDVYVSLLDELKEQYDYIIIDTPPVNVVSDCLPIAKCADGVVMMVRANRATYPELDKALNSFDLIGAKVLGIVLNGVDIQTKVYGRYSYRKYENGYGYGYNKSRSAD